MRISERRAEYNLSALFRRGADHPLRS